MGLFSSLLGGVVKVATTPIAVVADVVDVAKGKEPKNTKKHVKSIEKDIDETLGL